MATSFRPRKLGVSYSEALAKAYASAPDNEVILDTLEFRHPAFTVDGVQVAARVVNDHTPLDAYLEATAPLNPGEQVTFQPVRFAFDRPSESDSGRAPELQLTVNNVARLLVPYAKLAKDSRDPITVTWRPYLTSDLSTPHCDPPLTFVLRDVNFDISNMVARAGYSDFANRRWPAKEYTQKLFPWLSLR